MGERLISVRGFEGSVDISEIVGEFMIAVPLRCISCGLEERLACDNLRNRIVELYADSDKLLARCPPSRWIVPVLEIMSVKYMRRKFVELGRYLGDDEPTSPFVFSAREFRSRWPHRTDCRYQDIVSSRTGEIVGRKYYATREMVLAKLSETK